MKATFDNKGDILNNSKKNPNMDPQQTHKCKLKHTLDLQKINHLMNIYTNNIKRN